jgi:hypothetical protein
MFFDLSQNTLKVMDENFSDYFTESYSKFFLLTPLGVIDVAAGDDYLITVDNLGTIAKYLTAFTPTTSSPEYSDSYSESSSI